MVSTSLPLQEVVGARSGAPVPVLEIVSGVINAGLAQGRGAVHPSEVAVGSGARVVLRPRSDLPPHPLTTPPEGAKGEAGLVYAAAAVGCLVALRELPVPPDGASSHADWLREIESCLACQWAGYPLGTHCAELLIRCLAHDPGRRPPARGLLAAIRDLELPSEEGLVLYTGFAAPSFADDLPEPTPAAVQRAVGLELTPSFGRRDTPLPGPTLDLAPRRTPERSERSEPRSPSQPPRIEPARAGRRLGLALGIGCALVVGAGISARSSSPSGARFDASTPSPPPRLVPPQSGSTAAHPAAVRTEALEVPETCEAGEAAAPEARGAPPVPPPAAEAEPEVRPEGAPSASGAPVRVRDAEGLLLRGPRD